MTTYHFYITQLYKPRTFEASGYNVKVHFGSKLLFTEQVDHARDLATRALFAMMNYSVTKVQSHQIHYGTGENSIKREFNRRKGGKMLLTGKPSQKTQRFFRRDLSDKLRRTELRT